MQTATSPSFRANTVISILGVALIILGFLLPMFIQSNPQVPSSAHPIYEWQAVTGFGFSTPLWIASLSLVAALPILGVLIVLAESIAALFLSLSASLISLRRIVAIGGSVLQLLLQLFLYVLALPAYARTDVSWGFGVILSGFIIMAVGAFLS